MRYTTISIIGFFLVVGLAHADAQSASGATSPADRSAEVMFFPQDQVAESFLKGGTLEQGTNYKVMTAKRDAPGEVEVHTRDTDVFYVVAGSATIVVGGKVVGEKPTAPEELRGTSIEGGQVRHLSAGEVVVIPAGIPHWFNSVDPPFRYFVVKVATAAP